MERNENGHQNMKGGGDPVGTDRELGTRRTGEGAETIKSGPHVGKGERTKKPAQPGSSGSWDKSCHPSGLQVAQVEGEGHKPKA